MSALTHEEWSFSWWSTTHGIAGHTSYRLINPARAWYCWAMCRTGRPTLHITEFDIPRRANPMIVKAEALWAEFVCDAPDEQWSFGHEAHAVELDDVDDAWSREDGLVFGRAVPVASDLEWHATDPVRTIPDGTTRAGVVLGIVETEDGPVDIPEMRGVFMHRTSTSGALPLWPDTTPGDDRRTLAHLGPRLAYRFPDHGVLRLVLSPEGWRRA